MGVILTTYVAWDDPPSTIFQAISDLDKVQELCWDEESLRALLHGATNQLLLGLISCLRELNKNHRKP